MKYLYLDTTSSFLYLGLIENEKLVKEIKEEMANSLSERSLIVLSKALEDVNWKLKDIDKIILVNGPGSFTGSRIGVTIAKVLAWSLNKEITVISSLEAMAISSEEKAFKIPLIDARRAHVYAAIYDENDNLVLKEQYLKLEVLKLATEKLGDNYIFISNNELDLENKKNYDPNILRIVEKVGNRESINPHSIDVNYLKLSEAEEKKIDSQSN